MRAEALPVAHSGVYGSDGSIDPESDHELNIDVEKAKGWDLTEKAEYGERVRQYVAQHDSHLKEKAEAQAKANREKAEKDYRRAVRMEAKKLARKSGGKPDSI